MKVLSLFDGISCGMVALERAGVPIEKYVAYEIDEDAIKVSKSNYPQIEHKGDVFEAKYIEGEFDLLIGGSPCTYWSIAKAGSNGKKGKRETTASGLGWDLFSQYVRALKEVKPKYFLYENNASMSDDIRECISKELGRDPIEIDSADFSAQHRRRLYWTNILFSMQWNKSEVLFSDILDKKSKYHYQDFSKYKDTVRIRNNGMDIYFDTSGKGYYSQQSRAKKINQKWNTVPTTSGKNNIWVSDYVLRYMTPIEAERLQTLPDNYTECLSSKTKRIKGIGNGWTVDVIAHIFKGLMTV